jgi:hypothetical protein
VRVLVINALQGPFWAVSKMALGGTVRAEKRRPTGPFFIKI